jgi:hypothetical protein
VGRKGGTEGGAQALYRQREGEGEVEGCGSRQLAIDGRRSSRGVGASNGRDVEGGGGAAINCDKTLLKGGKEGEGARADAARAAAARIRAGQRKERGGRRRRIQQVGLGCQRLTRKRKR